MKRYAIRSLTLESTGRDVYSPCPVFFTLPALSLAVRRAWQQGQRAGAVCLPRRHDTG